MHGYSYSAHEQQVAALARELGFPQVSASHEVSPLIKLVGRGDTTVVDSYLSPILRRYVAQVAGELEATPRGLRATRLMFMMSSGGLTAAELFRGKDAILSGPAGGVVGMAETGREAGFKQLIGFDMGGTSTDVSHFAGDVRAHVRDGSRGRAHARADDADSYGGGRRRLDSAFRRRTFPRRPGIRPAPIPGPKCYRRGGPLAVTDANVMVGKLIPDFFPKIFGPRQNQPLDAEAVRTGFAALAKDVGDGRTRGAGRRRLYPDRGREHGERDQENLGAARLRCDRLRAQLLRRRRGPTRLPGSRCAGHDQRCSSIRFPRCSRPTGWGSPIFAASASRRSRSRSATSRCRRRSLIVSSRLARDAAMKSRAKTSRRTRSRCTCARISVTPAPTRR